VFTKKIPAQINLAKNIVRLAQVRARSETSLLVNASRLGKNPSAFGVSSRLGGFFAMQKAP